MTHMIDGCYELYYPLLYFAQLTLINMFSPPGCFVCGALYTRGTNT